MDEKLNSVTEIATCSKCGNEYARHWQREVCPHLDLAQPTTITGITGYAAASKPTPTLREQIYDKVAKFPSDFSNCTIVDVTLSRVVAKLKEKCPHEVVGVQSRWHCETCMYQFVTELEAK